MERKTKDTTEEQNNCINPDIIIMQHEIIQDIFYDTKTFLANISPTHS